MDRAIQHILKEITAERQQYERALLDGHAKDFAEYRNTAGVIRGLTQAEYIIKDLVQKLEKLDE